jgi:LysR family transcriptional regulator, transcriptional activator of the cysJI operon
MFCDLAETKSFTKTAKGIGVSQSAISQSLMALEKNLDARLVERKRRSFKLTPQGQITHKYCQEIARLVRKLEGGMQEMKDARSRAIELAVCHSIALYQLPSILRKFQKDYLATTVRVRYGNANRVYEDVLEDKASLGLVSFPKKVDRLKIETFHHERLVLVCHPKSPLAARLSVSFLNLKSERFIAWKQIPWPIFLRPLHTSKHFHYQPVREFEELELVKRAVEVEMGVSILPEATVSTEVANKILVAVPFKNNIYQQPLAVIYRRTKSFPPEMRKFIQCLKRMDGI